MSDLKMSDLKMSDVFSLPLRAEIEKTYIDEYDQHIYDSHGDVLIGGVPEDVDGNYVVEAINSHDKLLSDLAESQHKERDMRNAVKVSHGSNQKLKAKLAESQAEVERLREMLGVMTGFYGSTLKDDGIEPVSCRHYNEAKKLLSKDGE